MNIWFKKPDPIEVTQRGVGSANQHVGIEITEVGPDYLKARIPVDDRTRQPGGVLHGGISVVLAETLASWGAEYAVDSSTLNSLELIGINLRVTAFCNSITNQLTSHPSDDIIPYV
ncbi:MAG: PaaI family thioesterase [Desulfobacteraceae bacterium]|jgi:uncharacterized protein (TIGR00369 family)